MVFPTSKILLTFQLSKFSLAVTKLFLLLFCSKPLKWRMMLFYVGSGVPSASLAIMGRFSVNISYNIGLQYAAELLPTVVRAQGVALIHIMGYVASIVAPFVVYLVSLCLNKTLTCSFLLGFICIALIIEHRLKESISGESLLLPWRVLRPFAQLFLCQLWRYFRNICWWGERIIDYSQIQSFWTNLWGLKNPPRSS